MVKYNECTEKSQLQVIQIAFTYTYPHILHLHIVYQHSPSYGTVMMACGASRRRVIALRCGASERCVAMHAEGIVVWVSFFEAYARPLTKQVSKRVKCAKEQRKNNHTIK